MAGVGADGEGVLVERLGQLELVGEVLHRLLDVPQPADQHESVGGGEGRAVVVVGERRGATGGPVGSQVIAGPGDVERHHRVPAVVDVEVAGGVGQQPAVAELLGELEREAETLL